MMTFFLPWVGLNLCFVVSWHFGSFRNSRFIMLLKFPLRTLNGFPNPIVQAGVTKPQNYKHGCSVLFTSLLHRLLGAMKHVDFCLWRVKIHRRQFNKEFLGFINTYCATKSDNMSWLEAAERQQPQFFVFWLIQTNQETSLCPSSHFKLIIATFHLRVLVKSNQIIKR